MQSDAHLSVFEEYVRDDRRLNEYIIFIDVPGVGYMMLCVPRAYVLHGLYLPLVRFVMFLKYNIEKTGIL